MEEFVTLLDRFANIGVPLIITALVIYLFAKYVPILANNYNNYLVKKEESIKEQTQILKQTQEERNRQDIAHQEKFDALYKDVQVKYEEQLHTIFIVAQQGVEVARRSNEVIERNSIVMEQSVKSNDNLQIIMENLRREIKDLRIITNDSIAKQQECFTELLRLGDEVRRG